MARSTRRFILATSVITATATAGALLVTIPATPAGAVQINKKPAIQQEKTLPYQLMGTPQQAATAQPTSQPRPHSGWPAAGAARVSLSGAGSRQAGTLPVRLSAATSGTASSLVQLRSHADAERAGVAGVLISIAGSSPGTRVSLDYSSFANAGGANYGSRLHLVGLPGCALTTPELAACQVQTPLPSSANDAAGQTVSAAIPATRPSSPVSASTSPTSATSAGSTMVLAAVAGASGSNNDFTATSLAPSGSWTGGGSAGDFNWSYPITLPPAATGTDVVPSVSLSYDSSSVDGRVASTNDQTSWIGQGWDYSPGFIERTYRPCSDQTGLVKADQTGEECWAGQILSYSVNGSSNQIVQDDTDHSFHLKNDDGSRVQLIGAGSGAYQNEYWVVTDISGVQYFFGRDTLPGGDTTSATWTVPVCGDSNTSCTGNGSGTISPIENQAWRWNLDYVLDPHGNATVYHYAGEQNYYGQLNKTTPVAYTRGGYLTEIDYGIRATSTSLSAPSDKVSFTVAERCTSTCTTFDKAHAANWPDTPQDQDCASTGTCNNHVPTYWSRKRVTAITTYFNNAGSYTKVDAYALAQSFPTTGDPELELDSITRTGYSSTGTALAMPKVGFTYQLLDNRVAGYKSQPAMQMWRLNQVATETGEKILVKYDQAGRSPAQCTSTTVPTDPSQDTKECYPVYWTPVGYLTPQLDYFHKHLVTEVDVDDALATSPDRYSTYSYLGTPAWHFDDNELVKPKNLTYGQFRGFQTVQTRTGNPNHASNGIADAWTLTTNTYYRGMDGDQLPSGTRSATVTDSLGHAVTDSDQYAGTTREQQAFNGDGGAELSATINTPTTIATTATRNRTGVPDLVARMVDAGSTVSYTDLATGGSRQDTSTFEYDSIGRQIHASDTGTGVDPVCTTTHYADNTGSWIRDLPSEVIKSAQVCPTGSTAPSNIVGELRNYYDTATSTDSPSTLGTVPDNGDLTEVDTLKSATHWAISRSRFDASGRVTDTTVYASASDARTTHTDYTPATGGPTTKVTTTNPAGQQSSTSFDPSRGLSLESIDTAGLIKDATYDPVGRLTAAWLPGQVKGRDPATKTYSYTFGPTAPLATTSNTLVDPGNGVAPGYITSVSIFDAFGGVRQTQAAAVGGGRNITDSYADGHGWVSATNNHWHTTGNPAAALITTAQSGIEDSTRTVFDGAGRATSATAYNGTTAKWTTRTVYSGDRTTSIPPAGATESTTVTDARGASIELDQWTTPPVISNGVLSGGVAVRTQYSYDALGRRVNSITGAGTTLQQTWTNHYGLDGQIIQQDDPDTGTTLNSYDDAGELLETDDAASTLTGAGKLLYTYDAAGHKTGEYHDAITAANKLASWSYDPATGRPQSSTSYTAAGNYTQKITGYTATGDPTGTELDLPAGDVAAGFAPSYVTSTTWTSTHLPVTSTPAPGGSLPAETVREFYDSFGNPTGTTGFSAYVSAASYTPYGEPSQYTLGVNNQTAWLTFSRDGQTGRVTGVNLSAQVGTPQLENLGYSYDPTGNLTKTVDTQGASGAPTETSCFDYDALDQLAATWSATDGCASDVAKTASNATVGGPQPYWLSWSVNAIGERQTQTSHALAGSSTADAITTYDNGVSSPQSHAHALDTTSTTVGTSQVNSSSYSYDANGNVVQRTVGGLASTLAYNPDGRVDTISTSGIGNTSYSYDADGTELVRREPGSTTLYLPSEELRLDTSTKLITATRYYSHNGTTVAMRVGSGPTSYQVDDSQGTVQTVVPTTSSGVGTPIRQHTDPFGNPIDNANGSQYTPATASWPDQHAFLNKSQDSATGLVEMGARTYDPASGRFLQSDPVLDTTDPQAMSGYAYADNNPITKSDAGGTDPAGPCSQWDNRRCYPGSPWYSSGDPGACNGCATTGTSISAIGAAAGAGGAYNRTTRHNQARDAAIRIILQQSAKMHVAGQILTTEKVAGANKACLYGRASAPADCSYGVPDIVFRTKAGVDYIWEVKSVSQAASAQTEAQWYVDKTIQNGGMAVLGWSIGGPYTVGNGDNIEGPWSGAVIYGRPGQKSRSHQMSTKPAAAPAGSATPSPSASPSAPAPSQPGSSHPTPTAALPGAAPGRYPGTADVPGVGTMPLCSYDCGSSGFMTVLAVGALIAGALTGVDEAAAAGGGGAAATDEIIGLLSGAARSDFALAA